MVETLSDYLACCLHRGQSFAKVKVLANYHAKAAVQKLLRKKSGDLFVPWDTLVFSAGL